MTYDVGDSIALSTVVKNSAGTPVNTPTLTIAVTKPDGTAVSPAPTVTNTGAGGVYTATVTVDQAGIWRYVWTASGTVVGTDPGQFDVAAARAFVASLDELKAHLRLDDTDTEDSRLRDVLAAVTDIVEPVVGYVTTRTVTEWHHLNGYRTIAPRLGPLDSVTSITLDQSTAVDSSSYFADAEAGVIRLRTSLNGLYQVVYVAGWDPWPANLKLAGLIICQHEWSVRNGNGRPSPDFDQLAIIPGSGYLVPHRALELMRRDMLPGVA